MNNIGDYGYDFYKNRHNRTAYSAQVILPKVYSILPVVNSIVDVGCGVGTWLATSKNLGAKTVTGLDGPWVDKKLLEISADEFIEANLDNPIELGKRFDLAISLEVAEHITATKGATFVQSLTNLSDFILFSAAPPLQGGKNHVNEQWPDYWIAHFKARNYTVIDFIRSDIWEDERIPFWYKQNTLVFVCNDRLNDVKLPADIQRYAFPVSRIIHPDAYIKKHHTIEKLSTIRGSFKALRKSLKQLIIGAK